MDRIQDCNTLEYYKAYTMTNYPVSLKQYLHASGPMRSAYDLTPGVVPMWLSRPFASKNLTVKYMDTTRYIVSDGDGVKDNWLCLVAWRPNEKTVHVRKLNYGTNIHVEVNYDSGDNPGSELVSMMIEWILEQCGCYGCKTLSQTVTCNRCENVSYCTVRCMAKHSGHRIECRGMAKAKAAKCHDKNMRLGMVRKEIQPLCIVPHPPVYTRAEWLAKVRSVQGAGCLFDVPMDLLRVILRQYTDVVTRCMCAATCKTLKKLLPRQKTVAMPMTMYSAALQHGYTRIVEWWSANYKKMTAEVAGMNVAMSSTVVVSAILEGTEVVEWLMRNKLLMYVWPVFSGVLWNTRNMDGVHRVLVAYGLCRERLGVDLRDFLGRKQFLVAKKEHVLLMKSAAVSGDVGTVRWLVECGWDVSTRVMRKLVWKLKVDGPLLRLGRLEVVRYLRSVGKWQEKWLVVY